LGDGKNINQLSNMKVYVQGGNAGQIGYNQDSFPWDGAYGFSDRLDETFPAGEWTDMFGKTYDGKYKNANSYSGSFSYEISFLDKDHVLIADVDKDEDLFEGIGLEGVALIPSNLNEPIKGNIDYYLRRAGLLKSTPSTVNKKDRRYTTEKRRYR
jgi:hypothetical protein